MNAYAAIVLVVAGFICARLGFALAARGVARRRREPPITLKHIRLERMNNPEQLRRAAAAYVNRLERSDPNQPINTTHFTLASCRQHFGREAFDAEVDRIIKERTDADPRD